MREEEADRPINTWAAWRPFLKPLARVLVLAQVALALQPLSVLAQEKGQAPYNPVAQAQLQRLAQLNQSVEQAKASRGKTPADAVSDKLVQAQELVARLRSPHTPNKPEQHRQLKALLGELTAGAADVRAEFAATRAHLEKKKLPAEILARHDEAVRQFEDRAAQFARIASDPDTDESRVAKLAEFFDKFPNKRKPGKFDPKKLPWSTPQPNRRPPAETKLAWFQNLYGDQKIRLAQAGGTNIGPLQFTIPPEPGQAPTEADLAETDEVQITQEIRTKAAELGNNPLNIYNWVRNNIEWAPTAGAIQSAQDTLEKKRGNSTDTASLLIALLRAGNIPARYQWGTIDVDASRAMNWVGGASRPEAVLQFLNQGGIAARGIASGGRLDFVRMEHVWVQAYVNWTPGRGSRNAGLLQHPSPNGSLNRWIPLDPAFKQYTLRPGLDLKASVPVDANAALDALRRGAEVNDEDGWIRNANRAAVQAEYVAYRTRLGEFLKTTAAGENSTFGEVVGKKILPVAAVPLLAGDLPNKVVAVGAQSSAVPAARQQKFMYRLYASPWDQANDSPMLSFMAGTATLAGKRVTLTAQPATSADAAVLSSFVPQHSDGSSPTPTELPASLPGYLIAMQVQLRLDGAVVAQADRALPLGSPLYSSGGFTTLWDANQWDITSEETNTVGNATVIATSPGGISPRRLHALQSRFDQAKQQIQNWGLSPVSGEELSGSVLQAAVWSWFAAAENHSLVAKDQVGVLDTPIPSYGLIHAVADPAYSFGVVRQVQFPGISMDIGHFRQVGWAKDNDAALAPAYARFRGEYLSTLEHAIPERFFSDAGPCAGAPESLGDPIAAGCAKGVSAVKALALAGGAGQKIFTVTPEKYATHPGKISGFLSAHSESTRTRILQALDAGYQVTFHEAPITHQGWTGAGFILADPGTGSGAYLIEGGSNGVWLALVAALLIVMLALMFQVAAPALIAGAVGALGVGYNILLQKWLGLTDGEKMFVDIAEGVFSIALFAVFAILGSPVASAIFGIALLMSVYMVIFDAACFYITLC